MSNLKDFLGGGRLLAPPTPQPKAANIAVSGSACRLPAPAADGSFVQLPTSSGSAIALYTADGTVSWLVYPADVVVQGTFFDGYWLDTSDAAIWAWVNDGSGTHTFSLVKIALADGAVTVVGTCQPGNGLFGFGGNPYIERAAMGAGDFTIRDGDWGITLSSVNGSIVSAAAQISQNGMVINSTANYQTADGLLYFISEASLHDGVINFNLLRGGQEVSARLATALGWFSGGYPCVWGDYVAIVGYGGSIYGARFFERAAFDEVLHRVASEFGCPGAPA